MKENKKIEDLNSMELMRLILEEVKNNGQENNKRFDAIENKLKEHEKILKEHDKKFNILEQKIDYNFKYLDEKIDNVKNQLVSEISKELNNFSVITSKLIANIEKKVDKETNERKTDILKVKDFNKIILNDFGSRISILEEESEKYNLN